MAPPITFYDLPSNLPGRLSPSPNTWKIRLSLNYKNLPYQTTWVEYPDIKPLYLSLSIPASASEADGSPYYTLPLIHDASTNTYISESSAIARYLDSTYPDSLPLYPFGGLHTAFTVAFESTLSSLFQFALPAMNELLNPRSQAYFVPKKFGATPIEDIVPKGKKGEEEWAKVKADFAVIDGWYQDSNKKYIGAGDRPTFSDLEVAAWVLWLKVVFGEESDKWGDVQTWNGGRWAELLKSFEAYIERSRD